MKMIVPDVVKGFQDELNSIRRSVILDAQGWLQDEQKNGFDLDPEFILTNNGRETKRNFDKLIPNSAFLNIGTVNRPLKFTFSSGGSSLMITAALSAYKELKATAPKGKTGQYSANIQIWSVSKSGTAQMVTPAQVQQGTAVPEGATLRIISAAAHAAIIESGFYTKYYSTRPSLSGKGIIFNVTKIIRAEYGNSIAIRFFYWGMPGGKGTVPCLEIGRPGAFPARDTRPGKAHRKTFKRTKRSVR